MSHFKESLVQSVVCTAAFAIVFGIVVSCGGRSSTVQQIVGSSSAALVRLIADVKPSMTTIPRSMSSSPLLAAVFQTSSGSGSQLQQSFTEGGPCNYGNGSYPIIPASGYIPFQGNNTGTFTLNGKTVALACAGVEAQIGGPDEISGGTLSNPGGYPVYFSGTLTTLVVTGITAGGVSIRCSDLTTTVSVQDEQAVEAYYVAATGSVVLAIGTNQLPFTCNLNIPAGDQINGIQAQWAKI
jgi:hypothetical protein